MINVLIVDDDSMVAELNRLFLSRVADFHCCGVAPTVREAREMLSHLAQVDLVLLDVYMQQENGLDLLPALRADARNIDVIMITSAADRCTVQTALHYGVVDYLIKPFQFPRFEEALLSWRKKRDLKYAKSSYAQADVDSLLRSVVFSSRKAHAACRKDLRRRRFVWCASGLTPGRSVTFRPMNWPRRCRYPGSHAANI